VRALVATICLGLTILAAEPVGRQLKVPAGGDLQSTINRARSGDTILLARGATYTGNFTLPVRTDADGVVTIRTEGDEGFPGDGERISPAASAQLAKLRSPNSSPALATAPATRGWRIALVELLANKDGAGDIVTLGDGSSVQSSLDRVPADFTLDRLYIHGDPMHGQKRGIALNSARTTITGCYINDIKTIGQDSQAILGWNGPGDYVIENNYLEAAGENLMFGAADPSIHDLVPTKIVVRENLLSKPLAWRDAAAPHWQIKNLFELKNARQVVVERNVMERSWPEAQTGYAVLFTVRNQDGGCPWCLVEDVEFRGNLVRQAAGGMQILGVDNGHPSRQTNRLRIHDNVFDGIDRRAWGGEAFFLLLTDGPRDVVIDHNTIVQGESGGLIKIADGVTRDFKLTNNVASHGDYGIIGTNHGVGKDSISAYLPGAVIAGNAIAGANGSAYPDGNRFPTLEEFRRQFAGFDRHDYRLAPRSDWRRGGLDGRDLGANLDLLPQPR
jgi:hypothetical protein